MLPSWAMGLAGLAVAAGVSGYIGHGLGVDQVQGRWDAAELARRRAEAADQLRQAERAMQASATHEAERARLAASLRTARHDLQQALQQPIDCPPGGRVPLASVRVPGAVVDSLRRAGADHPAP